MQINLTGIITIDELPDVLDSIGLKPSPEEVEVRHFILSFIQVNSQIEFLGNIERFDYL